ncbi:type I secretion system permease/ATPase [Azospirillum sp. sgz301742]
MTTPCTLLLRDTVRQLRKPLLLLFAVAALCNGGVILVSLYNMELYNRVVNTRNLDTLTALTVGFVMVLAVYGVLEYLRSALYMALGARIVRRLALPTVLGAAAQAGDGGTASAGQAIRDLQELRMFLSGPAIGTLFDLVWTPLFLGALFMMHWIYGVYAVTCAAAIMLINGLSAALTKRPLAEADAAMVQAFAEIASAVRHAEAVEALGMFPAVARRWQRKQAEMLDLTHAGLRTANALSAAAKAFRMLVTAGMVALGLILTFKGMVSGGSMLSGIVLLARLLMPFAGILETRRKLVSVTGAFHRVKQALDQPAPRRNTMALPRPSGRLTADRLVYIPPGSDRPIIRGISFTVEPGETIGIVGPSGAGKSTLIRLILGVLEPTSGGVYLDGNSTFLWEREDFGRHIGFLPQSVSLIDGTIAENITRLRDGDPRDLITAARRAGVHPMIAGLPFGYETTVTESGHTLSGGQRQLVGLARALYGGPRLLVLDEPNSNLDQAGERALVEAISAAKRDGTSILIVAHRPSIMATADKLLVLKDGVIDVFGEAGPITARLTGQSGAVPAEASLRKLSRPKLVSP